MTRPFILWISVASVFFASVQSVTSPIAPYPEGIQKGGASVRFLWQELSKGVLRRTLPGHLSHFQTPWSHYLNTDAQSLAGSFFYQRNHGNLYVAEHNGLMSFLRFLKFKQLDAFALQGPSSDFRDLARMLVHDYAQKLIAAQQREVEQNHLAGTSATESISENSEVKLPVDGVRIKEKWFPDEEAERKEWGRLLRLGSGDEASSNYEIGAPSSGKPTSM